MTSSVVLLVTLLTAATAAAAVGQSSPAVDSQRRAFSLHRSERLIDTSHQSAVYRTDAAASGTGAAAGGTGAAAGGTGVAPGGTGAAAGGTGAAAVATGAAADGTDSAAVATGASADGTDSAAVATGAAAGGTDAGAGGTDTAAGGTSAAATNASITSRSVPQVLRRGDLAKNLGPIATSVELQKDLVTSQDQSVTSLDQGSLRFDGDHAAVSADESVTENWADGDDADDTHDDDSAIDPRFVIISSNSTLVRGTFTALAVIGKIILTVLLLCLAVSLFFALGLLGNTSQVYNRYGHYDPYSPWGPYTANGAIDQPGYGGRALDAGGGGLAALLTAVEAALSSTAPCHPPAECKPGSPLVRPARVARGLRERRPSTGRAEIASNNAPVRRRIASPTGSRWPPGGDRANHQLSAAPRQSSENGPAIGAVQSVVSLLVPVALVLPWLVILFFPGLLPAGDGSAVPPDDFPFDSDDDDNDRPYRRRRRRDERRGRRIHTGAARL